MQFQHLSPRFLLAPAIVTAIALTGCGASQVTSAPPAQTGPAFTTQSWKPQNDKVPDHAPAAFPGNSFHTNGFASKQQHDVWLHLRKDTGASDNCVDQHKE